MQVTIDMNDELYNAYLEQGINVKEMLTAYLQRMRPDVSYTFLENKAYFQQVLEEVESGEAVLLEHDEVWEEIDRQTT
jgi:methanogenic corrinoid protein MtbC1